MALRAYPKRPLDLDGSAAPRANGVRANGGGLLLNLDDPEVVAYLKGGALSASGAAVTADSGMRIATAWRCIHIIAGACGNMPLDLYRRVGEDKRVPAANLPLRQVLTRRPNGWQTPKQFRGMLTAHKLLHGAGYALKITSRGQVIELWPLKDPTRVKPRQLDDMSIVYDYQRENGSTVTFTQADILHLRGLSLDGVNGLGVIRHAREAMGLALQTEKAGANLFRQGVLAGGALTTDNALSEQAYGRLKQSIEDHNAGAENAHKMMILEEGLKLDAGYMSAEDAQFLETRKFQRNDIAMFFGVPPFMLGDTEKSTSWGAGIEQQGIGFVQYTLEDHFKDWEETIARDLLDPKADRDVFARLDPRGLMRGDIKTRQGFYVAMLQWGVFSPNEVRALEDVNPREGGDVYYPPPNTAGASPNQEQDSPDAPSPADDRQA
jgi:HK97 family phage portal protein